MSVKTKLHKALSPLLYKSGCYSHHWRTRSVQRPFTVALMYHRVLDDHESQADMFGIEKGVSASVFEAQLRFMLKHFTPIRASEALEPSAEPLRFTVTLDDGYEDNIRVAAPILRRLGITATFYVVSDHVGSDRQFWWEQVAEIVRSTKQPHIELEDILPAPMRSGLASSFPLQTQTQRVCFYECITAAMRSGPHSQLPNHLAALSNVLGVRPREEGRDYAMMDWNQLKELVHQGFDIGGHTASHCNLDGMSQAGVKKEIVDSNNVIEEALQTPVLTFAYPYGHYENLNMEVNEALAATNCRVAYTAVQGVVEKGCKIFELPRVVLNRRYDFACAFNVQDSLS